MKYILGITLLISLIACGTSAKSVGPDALVITNGTVIDGTGRDAMRASLVVIQGDQVTAVGPSSDFEIHPETDVIDAGGGTILPGIINAHVHRSDLPITRRLFLSKGVTAVCDVGAPLRQMKRFEQDRDTRERVVARGFKAGPIITVPLGYPGPAHGYSLNYEATDPDEARAAVADLLDRGADVIKIALEPGNPANPWPVLSLEQVQAIVSAAHASGALVRAHVQQGAMLDIALDGGVDIVDHVPLPPGSETEAKRLYEGDISLLALTPDLEVQLSRMAEQGVILVSTLEVIIGPTPRNPFASGDQPLVVDYYLDVVRRFRELGGIVALGDDYPLPGAPAGMPLGEMELLMRAGLTPMEVIEAGTRHAARVCGHGAELGTLEPGKLADVIIVDGDPLSDIEAMDRVVTVIKGGEVAYPSE